MVRSIRAKLSDLVDFEEARGALSGPLPESLPYAVDMDDLVQKQLENLNTYWASWTSNFRRRLALLSDWVVEWSVLGVLLALSLESQAVW